MKKIVTVFTVIILMYQNKVGAQQILPTSRNENKSMHAQMKSELSKELKNIEKLLDTISDKSIKDSLKLIQMSTETKLDSLKDPEATVTFYGGATLNSTNELDNIGGTSRVSAQLKLAKKVHLNLGYNIKGVKPETVSKDSFNLISLMFPEVGNSGWLSTISWDWIDNKDKNNKRHQLGFYFDFAFKQSNIRLPILDTLGEEISFEKLTFSALNYNLGVKYTWTYASESNVEKEVNFTTMVYINSFNIPNEDAAVFEKVMQDNFDKKSNITGMGAKMVLQYKGLAVFGDFRQNFDTRNLKDDNAFKGFVFNVGTMITTDLFHF